MYIATTGHQEANLYKNGDHHRKPQLDTAQSVPGF